TSYGGSLKTSRDGKVKYAGWDSSHWDTNTTGGDAGAIMFTGNHEYLYNVTFINCTTTGRGGAVFLQDNTNVTFEYCNFTNNKALGVSNNTFFDDMDENSGLNPLRTGGGGAIAFDTGASYGVIKSSYFFNNTAARNGGAIDFYSGSSFGTVQNSVFINNTAKRSGGAMYWNGISGNVSYCNFTGNKALGTALLYDMALTYENVKNVTILPDASIGTMGKLYVVDKSTSDRDVMYESYTTVYENGIYYWKLLDQIHIVNDTVPSIIDWAIDEFFGGDGGTILWSGNIGHIDHCNFIDSDSARRGGGAYMTGGDYVEFTNCYFENCTSGTNGGGVDWLAGANYGKVINSTFNHTRAARSAGAIYYDGDYGEFKNILVIGTYAYGGSLKTSRDGKVKYAGWDSSHWDTNTTGGDAGAIMFTGSHINIYNATFINCTATSRGGAVFLQDNDNVTFDLCNFTNNRALGTANNTYYDRMNEASGFNPLRTGHGGAIGFDIGNTNGVVKNSYFLNNTAARNGGAVSFSAGSSKGTILNSEFIDNTAGRSGGAFYWEGTDGNVSYCNFTNNKATGTALEYDMTLTLNDIIINTDKPAVGEYRKLYVLNQTVTDGVHFESWVYDNKNGVDVWILIDEITIVNDTYPSSQDWAIDQFFGGDGGTILWSGNIGHIDHCNFYDSNSARRGGGAYMTGGDHVEFTNCYFENCTSGTNGGGVDWLAGANYGKVINCTFNHTRAARSAGAIYYDGDYGEMRDVLIINTRSYGGSLLQSDDGSVKYAGWDTSHWDTNTTGGDAGAIMFTGSHINVYNATFINCTATGRGGAVFLQDNVNVTFDSCLFKSNVALGIANNTWIDDRSEDNTTPVYSYTGHGGAVAFDLGATNCTIKSSDFIDNYARRDGGAINFAVGSLNNTIKDSKFTNNSAGDDGGAINWDGDLGTVINITCYNNTGKSFDDDVTGASTSNGGTICLTGDNVTISDSKFTLSTVLLGANPDKKPYAGAIFLTGNYAKVINSTFDTCYCPDDAGAIYIIGNYTLINYCTFENCHSNENGGVMFIQGDYCELYNSTLTHNFAGNDGGAINWQGSHGIMENITCEFNNAISMSTHYSNGGTMAVEGNNISISKSRFSFTGALIAGGAIYITGNLINIEDSTFDHCNVSLTMDPKAGKKYSTGGGAIYVLGNDSNINNCNFSLSHAKHGGVIYIQGNNVNVTNAMTDLTFSSQGGGSIYVDGANATISGSRLMRTNSTESYGGAIYVYGENARIDGSNFTMTNAIKYGGAVYVSGYNATIIDSNFTLSSATESGGSIYIQGDFTEIFSSTFSQSHADVSGGVIYVNGKNAYIDGSDFLMSSSNDGGAVYVSGYNATIKESTFDKVNATQNGGAVYVNGQHTDIIDSNFTIAIAINGDGGAIYVAGANADIKGVTSSISQSTNGKGGFVYVNGDNAHIVDSYVTQSISTAGGAVYIDGQHTVLDNVTTFRTTSTTSGGAIYIGTGTGTSGFNTTIRNSHFIMSNATQSGGAVYIAGTYAKIENSTFNLTYSLTDNQGGGAVYIKGNNAVIEGSDFSNAEAYRGGFIYLEGSYCNVTNSSFDKAYARDSGGAVYSTGAYSIISNSNFTNNDAEDNGGAIEWYGSATSKYNYVIDCLFVNNTAHGAITSSGTRGGGAIYFSREGSYGLVRGSTFINNSVQSNKAADVEAGAILLDYNNGVIIDNCTFDYNYITTTSTSIDSQWIQGGAIYVRAHNFTLTNSVFKNCWSIKEAGALYIASNGHGSAVTPWDVIIRNVTFINNTAVSFGKKNMEQNSGGGAVQIKESQSNVWFDQITFINNTAYKGGALRTGVKSQGANVRFTNCIFDGNVATEDNGGSIHADIKDLNIYNVTISNSRAAGFGGGMFVANIVMNYDNLTFINNTANYGGGFYWERSNVNIRGMVFENNTAIESGGAVYTTGYATYNYNNFTGNVAQNGGAIYVIGSTSNIQYNNFNNNSAYSGGGAVYVSASTNIKNNNFTGNTALNGGAIDIRVNNLALSNNNFINNSATISGGAIYTPYISEFTFKVTDSNFTSNSAQEGGAVYAGYKFTGEGITFINNTATSRGGAVYILISGSKISSSYFDGNNADLYGGAIFIESGLTSFNIQNSEFRNSHALDGGAVYNDGGTSAAVIIKDSIFRNNTAEYNGGAVLYKILTADGVVYYRDYDNFDKQGIILNNGRTDLTAAAAGLSTKFIQNSLFEYNEDYMLIIDVVSDLETPLITVNLINPSILDKRSIKFIVNLTQNNTLVHQIIVDEDNFDTYYNRFLNRLSVNFAGLLPDKDYNVTVGFSNIVYLYKGNSSLDIHTNGIERGDFQLLQFIIETNIKNQKEDGKSFYEVNLTRSYNFIHYGMDGYTILDNGTMNLTDIDRPLIINGNGYSINALGYSRIFLITAANVTFDNVVFMNGNANGSCGDGVDIGGAIFWAGANGALNRCIIQNNTAGLGGGVYYNASASNCRISNSQFISNIAQTNGGAIDCNASKMNLTNTIFTSNYADYGAALCREINATEGFGHNNTFIANHAETAGAALAWLNASSIKIDTYFFYDNTAGYSGGAIYVGEGSTYCQVLNSVFENNNVTDIEHGHGGAIEWYAEEGLISNSTFTKNNAYDGGAVYVGTELGNVTITGSTFTANRAYLYGGAISLNSSSVTVNQSNFYDNTALEGGALYVGGESETNYIYTSVFEGNTATAGNGGAIDWVAASGTIIDSNLTRNFAMYGGGIYFGGLSAESRIEGCIFTDNHAKYNGGAIDCNASKMYLSDTKFDGNYAQFGAALCREVNAKGGSGSNNLFINNHAYVSGAALGWMGSVGITIVNYTFINNSADISGGAIYVSPDSHNCSIITSNFESNYVTNKTSGWSGFFNWVAWDGSDMRYSIEETHDPTLINKTIINEYNTVYYYENIEDANLLMGVGGAINCLAQNATLQASNFTDNLARLGGALFVGSEGGNTKINDAIFRSNEAYERGGAVNLHASSVSINNTKFYTNVAEDGAALYVGGTGSDNTIYNVEFDGNKASNYGAGIYWIAQAGVIADSSFTNNAAEYGGGIYFNGRSANTNVTNVVFKSNNATKNGGAIECNAANIGIYNLTFDSNYAGEYGAALCREVGATNGHGTNNTFISNHAGIAGAALAWMNVKGININDYHFIDNTAGSSGGAIYIAQGSDNCIINNSYFTGNHIINETGGHGGAIDVVADYATIINSNFTQNSAFYGGAIWVGSQSGTTNITNDIFTSNEANLDGGAINIRASDVNIVDGQFFKNIAGRSGGAIYVGGNGTTNTIYNSVFEKNTAESYGGAIDWFGSQGIITYTNFTDNTANYGGAIYMGGTASESILSHDRFTHNIASANGGAIDCNASKMNLTYTLFEFNEAQYGAALCREGASAGGFGEYVNFTGNHAYKSGAALAWLNASGIKINHYIFIDNTADVSGGSIYIGEGSDDCKILNSYFENSTVLTGRGGDIDVLADNTYVLNSTFINSLSSEGGSMYVGVDSTNTTIVNSTFTKTRSLGHGGAIDWHGDDGNIINSNFTYSFAFEKGGVISGTGAENVTIANSTFAYNVAFGNQDPSGESHGEGSVIYWENGKNLNITDSIIHDNEGRNRGGAISIVNTNSSTLYNLFIKGSLSVNDGGSISWIDSENIVLEKLNITASAASFNGGAIFFNNINNATVKDSVFNNTSTPWGNGGAMYVNGNVTIDNSTFFDFKASETNAGAIYFAGGNSTLSNSTFTGFNAIWIGPNAEVFVASNNITGSNPNKHIIYLERDYDSRYNPVDYSIWNDGVLGLDKNNFDYIIFNNGTITTNTTTYILDNKTWNRTWMENFTFYANITDDNLNTIISVRDLTTFNEGADDKTYYMRYNKITLPLSLQGKFVIYADDNHLEKNTVHPGTLYVKMPLQLTVNYTDVSLEDITFTATLTPPAGSNYTIEGQTIYFKINDNTFPITIEGGVATWTVATAILNQTHLPVGTYTITAEYMGDDFHLAVNNFTTMVLTSHEIWIAVHAGDVFYGQPIAINVTSNATNTVNGVIIISINGRNISIPLKLNKDGSYMYQYNETLEPGEYTVGVLFRNGTYYAFQTNSSTFNVLKLNTTIEVNQTTPIKYGEDKIINVTVNETAKGFIKITINGTDYYGRISDGIAQFNFTGLDVGLYENITVEYLGSNIFNVNSTNITFNVIKTDDYNITVKADEIKYGENATIEVILPISASGNVTIWIDNVPYENVTVTNGIAKLENISNLSGGEHIVNVTYNGNEIYASKSLNGTVLTVSPTDNWTLNLNIDAHTYGENTTFTVTLPENVSKNVTLTIDDVDYTVVLTNGEGNLTLNNISAGLHTATAKYAGDANYTAKSNSTNFLIGQATPYIIINADPITVGQNATVNITVSGNATGNVTIYVGSQKFERTLANHTVQINVTGLSRGTHNIVVFYHGDQNYTTNINSTTITVTKIPTSINITVGDEHYVDEAFNITVENTTAVNVTINGKAYTIVDGNITINANELAAGHYIVTATIYEDDKYLGNVTIKEFDIIKRAGEVNITISGDNPHYVGEVFTITVENNTVVNVTINGKEYTINATTGVVNINTAELGIGEYIVTATIVESDVYKANTTTKTFNIVRNASDLTITATPEVIVGKNTTFTVTMTGVKSGKVLIEINGITYAVNLTDGVAVLNVTLPVGNNYTAHAYFLGDENYSASNNISNNFSVLNKTSPVINITVDNVVEVENNITFTVNTTSNATLIVKVNGVDATYLGDNIYTYNATAVGDYTITAEVAENDYYFKAVNQTVVSAYRHAAEIVSVEVPALNITVGKNATIIVTMGNVTAGTILIEVGEHNYTVDIIGGIATLVVELPVGEYTAHAYFLGDDKYNATDLGNDTKFYVVVKQNATVIINNVSDVEIDNNLTFTVTNSTPVNVTVNGVEIVPVNGNYTFEAVKAGEYTIVVRSIETDDFYAGFNTTTFKVFKHDSPVNITVNDAYEIESDFNITIGNATVVNVTINGKVYSVVDGKVVIDTTELAAGNYTVVATIYESDKYVGNSTVDSFVIFKHAAVIDSVVVPTTNVTVGFSTIVVSMN
ncbi:Ig-like domain repeat protein, partial [Methanobrevibacter sp.]